MAYQSLDCLAVRGCNWSTLELKTPELETAIP